MLCMWGGKRVCKSANRLVLFYFYYLLQSMKLVIESQGIKKGRIIEGIALYPTISRNGNCYTIEAIDSASGLNVPLVADWEHTEEKIGNVVYTLDENTHTINYRAEITDDRRSSEITEGVHKVSIEASINEAVQACNSKRCYNVLDGITFEGIGITATPGVVGTTLSIIESHQDWKPILEKNCEKCKHVDESEQINSLDNRITNLENTVKELTTCKNCGKHKHFS